MRTTNEQNKTTVGTDASVRPSTKAGQNKGITLIALIITIIVMLILVAVTISMAINGGLFEYAGKAVGDMQNEIDKEQELANGKIQIGGTWYDSIDDYLEGKVLVELPEGIKVGDYVNYTPTAGTYKVADGTNGSGCTTTDGYQAFTTETGDNALQWRILSIDEETGEIELVSATVAPSSTTLHLEGADGYNHAVDILNDLCKELYSNENGATARSINVEDINTKTTYDYTTYTDYGTVYTPTYKQYPNIYAAELGSTAEGLNGTGMSGSEGVEKGTENASGVTEYSTYTGSSIAETLNATYTYYGYGAEDYLNTNLGVNTAPAGLINVGKTYWLASRCVNADSQGSYFCVRFMGAYGIVGHSGFFYSKGYAYGAGYAVRPVVSLGSTVQLTPATEKINNTTTWDVKF